MQYFRDVSEMSCGTTAIMQMRLQQQQDSSNHRNVQIFGRYFFLWVLRCIVEHSTKQRNLPLTFQISVQSTFDNICHRLHFLH